MTELAVFRKNKVELSEYECTKDLSNRVLMSTFSPRDVEILEEILYSSLRIPLSVLSSNLDLSQDELLPILEKLKGTKLFTIAQGHVVVDKEVRKYYEFQIQKFEEDFTPGLDYLQGLLKTVPIHVLPTWYSIPRTSNNIFESIVEKYLQTPQAFQRYLLDLSLADPVQKGIVNAIYQSPDYEVEASDMIKKFSLTQEEFEEVMLFLEFSFVSCVSYKKVGDEFREVITPYHEWREYLRHIRDTEPQSIIDEEQIEGLEATHFAFIDQMTSALTLSSEKGGISVQALGKRADILSKDKDKICERLLDLRLATLKEGELKATVDAPIWLNMDNQERALFLCRNPLACLSHESFPQSLITERGIREAEKSLSRAVQASWIYLGDFIDSIYIPLNESQHIQLVKKGRTWKYQLPEYSAEEIRLFEVIVTKWLYESGITKVGSKAGRVCFTLTALGREFYDSE